MQSNPSKEIGPGIEKGIPVVAAYSTIRKSKYPFRDLGLNESFLVEGTGGSLRKRVEHAARYAKSCTGFTFVVRRVPDGVRVWRKA